MSLGQIIAQVITMTATLFLSRIYNSSDYGLFGVITSSAAIIMSLISLGIGSAIMVVNTDEDAFRLLRTVYVVQLILTFLGVAILYLLSPIYRIFDLSIPYWAGLLIMVIYIMANVMCSLMRVLVNRLKKTNVLFFNSLINAGCTVFISIPLGLLRFGFFGLTLASILASAISALQMMRVGNPFKQKVKFIDILWMFKTCRQYILYQYPSNLMGTVAANIPNQTLYQTFGASSLGTYSMCNRIFQLPMNLIIAPIQTVYFRTAAQMKNDTENLSDFTLGFIKKILIVAVVPALILMSFGEQVFSLVLGAQWGESGIIAGYMTLYYVFFFLNSCTTYLRVAIGKTKQNLIMTIAQILSIIVALILSIAFKTNLINTIQMFAITNTLYNIADVFVSFVCMKRNAIRFLVSALTFSFSVGAIAILFRTII